MKWIKPINKFLNEEAKIKDVILPRQAKEVSKLWGEEYLELEEIKPTEAIKQGKWKLTEEDKIKALGIFFQVDLPEVYAFFNSLPDKFVEVLNSSVSLDLIDDDNWKKILNDFNIKKPTINQISMLVSPVFKKISVGETTADEVIVRDETGKPMMGEDKKPLKRKREEGEIIFSKNLVNINSFVEDWNKCFPEIKVNSTDFSSGMIQQLVSASKEDFGGDDFLVEVDIYARDLFLKIDHNPKDILNMSISRFYASCQHLYSGGYRERVISNVFDANSIPAFLVFDTPIHNHNGEMVSEQLPLSRMIIRNLETFSNLEKPIIFFDRTYPDRMKYTFGKIVQKYSGNIESEDIPSDTKYLFSPDIPEEMELREPYMDRLKLERGRLIGVNTKKLVLTPGKDWSRIKISPSAKIEEIIIETPIVPENFFTISLKPNWIKIKNLKINDMSQFSKIITDSVAFDKCILKKEVLEEINTINPGLKKLQLTACQVGTPDLSMFKNLTELQLVYTLDSEDLIAALKSVKFNKLVISTDVLSLKENKDFINSLKSKGVKVETIGPKI